MLSEICDVKFVLPRRKSKGDNKGDVVADVVCAHNVVVVSYTRSPMLKEMYEKHKNNRDYEFCVRIPVEVRRNDCFAPQVCKEVFLDSFR